MSYSFAVQLNPFNYIPSKNVNLVEFLISDGIVFHITGPEYDKLFLNKLMFGLGIYKVLI